ncbi:hypothetical protein [Mesobacillus stamsii]|uniref:Uncharacterized protein n=1 Tax=Mesobacillus stamsii TaxID=225347 RepID=A0ABU0FWF2_9BACI|nr:hypothetical protein [Mesobacillus stamsii]MDQ0414246.1 hypothetical protein [Mesobacillus stamsii]
MEQHKKQIALEEQLLLWEEEIQSKGYIDDEAGLIMAIKVLTI